MIISEISCFHCFDENDVNVSLRNAAGTMITSRALGTVKFKAADDRGDFWIIPLDRVPHVPSPTSSLYGMWLRSQNLEKLLRSDAPPLM